MAARIAPPPGIGPSGVGYVASSFVPISRAPLRTAVDAPAHALVVERAMETDHHRVDVVAGSVRDDGTTTLDASTTPGPPHTSTRSPGSISSAAAIADVSTSPSAGMPIAASAASCSATLGDELLVTNSTRWPAGAQRAIASTEPGIG